MYVSTKFATPQEFEAWLNNNEHPNKTALDEVTDTKVNEWDKKACQIAIANGKIQLKCKDGNVIAEAPLSNAVDGSTIGCSGDCLIVTGVRNQNGGIVKLWLGTTEAYNKIAVKDTNNTIYVKTDDNTIAQINASLKALADRATALEGRATSLEGRASSLEITAGTHSNDISGLKTRATNLESRATSLEGTDKTHTSDISGLKDRTSAVEGRATALENTDKTHTSDIGGLKTRATNLESRVTALETTDKNYASDISDLEEMVTDVEDKAEALEKRATTLESTAKTYGDDITSLKNNKSSNGHKHTKSEITDFPTSMTPTAHTHKKSEITDFPTSMPASDVYAWAKATSKPSYSASEVGAYSTAQVDTLLSGKSPSTHNHDDRYYTESEVDAKLNGKSDTGHSHEELSKINSFETWKTNVSNGTTSVPKATKLEASTSSISMSSGSVTVGLEAGKVYIFQFLLANAPANLQETTVLIVPTSTGKHYSTKGQSGTQLIYDYSTKKLTAYSSSGSTAQLQFCHYREI